MPLPRTSSAGHRVAQRRSDLRVHILAALGAAGCSQVPEAKVASFDGIFYDRIDKDLDGSYAGEDCNDANADIHPNAVEICNNVDDNCDGSIDEGVRAVYHRDADGDAYGSADDTVQACGLPEGFVENDEDCNDRAAEANPEEVEVCDGLDNDCDGSIDNIPAYWPDADGDGYGAEGTPATECEPMPEGYAPNQADCDDGDETVFPGAPELCGDRRDNDCDGNLSCVQLDVALEDTEEHCSVTWAMEGPQVTDYSSPCVGCDFEFETDLVVTVISGDADLCDAAVDARQDFRVSDNTIAGSTGNFYALDWDADGTWYGNTLYWNLDPVRLSLEGGSYASFSYLGELAVYEVEYYYSYYYGEGRPLSVQGEHRMAHAVDRTDWRSDAAPIASPRLSQAERARAVRAWTGAGLAEHASVASFNRFAMELMALGAPPDLLLASLQAAGDEIVHARDCFGVASALSGRDVGPGELPVAGVLEDPSVEGILTRLLTEGCVEETVSTSLAALRLAHATDKRIRSTLERIVSDETRHAAFAWRSARWLLSERPDLAPLARRVLALALAQPPPAGGPAVSAALRAHGVLSRADRARERARTVREVIKPAIAALFSDAPAPRVAVSA